jgi:NADH dehydrogenase/putative oxidoreductase
MTNDEAAKGVSRETHAATVVGGFAYAYRAAEQSLGPVLELAIRIGLAQIFFVSAVLKIANWDNALYLAANEYPVSWIRPATAAYLGVAIELIGSILLAFGLGTRFAAAALLVLSLVIQTSYLALDQHLFWAVLLGWFVVRGAGVLSLDHLLARGLADSALPFAGNVIKALSSLGRYGAPLYQLFLRLWIGGAILLAALTGNTVAGNAAAWLPLRSAAGFDTALEAVLAALLVVGLGTRLSALALICFSLVAQMTIGTHTYCGYWVAAFGLLALRGAGALSLDEMIAASLRQRFPQLEGKPAFSLDGLPRVVIVGAGFGGLTCAAALARARVSVTLIDRHNYHLFQPLLYQVATAGLSPGDIATPVRGLFREHFNTRVLLGEVSGVDTARQEVTVGNDPVNTLRVPYDYLVLATGAAHSYFGRDEWAPYAPGLKRVEDATEVRRRLLLAFERAEATEDPAEREALLTFLIVGAGPTGVELAGAIAELAKFGMEKEFRRFDPGAARVLLVQAGPRVLPTFPEALSETTRKSLEKLGVEVLVDSRVESIDDAGVMVSGKRIPSRTVLWAAGVIASPAAKWLGAEADNAGRVKVGPDLTVPKLANVYVIGDTALSNAWNGNPVPGLAPAAKQGGEYVAKVIRARVSGRTSAQPFRYQHLGSLATIGRKAAVADFGFVKLRGALAWWFWGAIHVGFLVGMRNRVSVMWDWFWTYLTYRSGTRLITGGPQQVESAQLKPAEPVRRVATV